MQQKQYIEFRLNDSGTCKRYEPLRGLGKGGFASVHLVQSVDSGRYYACKIIKKSLLRGKKEAQRKMKSEIKIHRKCSGHPGVVTFVNCFDDKDNLYILMEHVDGGSLMDLIKKRGKLSEDVCREFMTQLVDAVHYLHSERRVIHRDLKLANVLITSKGVIKICDFGLAANLENDGDRKTTICGTPNYIAPEIVRAMGKENNGYKGHSYEVDVWSLGVMMYIMICGVPPFQGSSLKITINRIKESDYSYPKHLVSSKAKNLIDAMLSLDPTKRPELGNIKKHKWFSSTLDDETQYEKMDISDISFLNYNVPALVQQVTGHGSNNG